MQGTAMVLGLPQSRCTARCRRMGGAFGGKTTRSVVPAAAVAVAANKLKRQVCHLSAAPPVVPVAAALAQIICLTQIICSILPCWCWSRTQCC